MADAEFSEREFELSVCLEMAEGAPRGSIFTIGQVLEGILGYDIAAAPPKGHPIWKQIGETCPRGVRLAPGYWPQSNSLQPKLFPATPASLILQIKRPEYLRTSNSLQWTRWRQPYFRFQTRHPQQSILARLEKRLGGDALVRYAAPAFWRRLDFEDAYLSGRLIESLGVVPPKTLVRHRYWTYREAGSVGFPNPSPKRIRFQTLKEALREIVPDDRPSRVDLDLTPQTRLRIYLASVAGRTLQERWRGTADLRDMKRWRMHLEEIDGLTKSSIDAIEGLAYLSTMAARAGGVWFLVDAAGLAAMD
jgi:hypothetical protein